MGNYVEKHSHADTPGCVVHYGIKEGVRRSLILGKSLIWTITDNQFLYGIWLFSETYMIRA